MQWHFHKTLYQTEDVPQDMVGRRTNVVTWLKSLEDAAALLITFLRNAGAVQELKADKQYNLQRLNDKYQIVPAQMEALLPIWKISVWIWKADYLYQYRALCTNSERSLSALWGKLIVEVLVQNLDVALEELNRLKEIIDLIFFCSSPKSAVVVPADRATAASSTLFLYILLGLGQPMTEWWNLQCLAYQVLSPVRFATNTLRGAVRRSAYHCLFQLRRPSVWFQYWSNLKPIKKQKSYPSKFSNDESPASMIVNLQNKLRNSKELPM